MFFMNTVTLKKTYGEYTMTNLFKSFTKRDLKMLSLGGLSIGVIYLFFFMIFSTASSMSPKMPQVEPLEPSAEMVEFFGKTNVLAQKFPLRIWHIDNPEFLAKVQEAFDLGKLTMGANNIVLEIGDYLMFTSSEPRKFWGYVEDGAQIENTYTIVKE